MSANSRKVSPLAWVPTVYFAMGLPFIIVNMVATLMFRGLGIDDARITLWTSLIILPWSLKPFWSPLMEMFRTKKFWVVTTQLVSGLGLALVAMSLPFPNFFPYVIALMTVVAFSGATHDIATDGVYITELSKDLQAKFIGWQGAFYNIAKVFAMGGLVYLAGALKDHVGIVQAWMVVMGLCGGILFLLGLYHIRMLPSGGIATAHADSFGGAMRETKRIFLEFFKDVPYTGELPEDLLDWLNHPSEDLKRTIADLRAAGFPDETLEELLKMLEERLKEQTEEHNGGNYWVGIQGRTPWGNNGWHPNGIRIGGQSMHRTAMMVAGERKFRDFRKDNKLDTRQFQMAFRTLRQLSAQERSAEKELDVDATIHDTCESAGRLEIRYKNPRKNTVKVLLLMDPGGSMDYYSGLCSQLFQAATKSNHFKELHTYYFHNCIYGDVYNGPRLWQDGQTPTEWLLQNFDASYKVILVGDAAMNPYELREKQYDWRNQRYGPSGLEWLELFKKHFPYLIWLNPEPLPAFQDFWALTHLQLAKMFPMFDLSAEGLEAGMKRLMVKR